MPDMEKTALITGGSRGIGKAIAKDFSKNGIDVVAVSYTHLRAHET